MYVCMYMYIYIYIYIYAHTYIRLYIYRIILENAAVRAAAVSALAKFGAMVPSLRESMVTLLRR